MSRFSRLLLLSFLLLFALHISAQENSEDTPFTLYDSHPVMNFKGDMGAMIEYDERFHMFANVYETVDAPVEIHYFVSVNATSWVQLSVEPILTVDAHAVYASDVIVSDDGTWMLYLSIQDNADDLTAGRIAVATADAPNGDWVLVDESILTPTDESWDGVFVSAPDVIQTDSGYAMYYSGGNDSDDLAIGYATSEDGITWEKQADPLITILGSGRIRPQHQLVWQADIIETAVGYFMIFKSGSDLYENGGAMVRYGQSTDGLTWEMDTLQQAFNIGEVGGEAIWQTQLLTVDGSLYLYMAVENEGASQIYLATLEEPRFDTSILDISNHNNASDIEIKLPNIDNYEIHIRRAESDSAIVLDESQYTVRISLDERDIRIRLSDTLADDTGETIVEGVPYTIELFDMISGELITSETLTLANENTVRTVIAGLDAAAGGIDVDAEGNIYFADFGESGRTEGVTVYQITPEGMVTPYLERNGLLTATGNVFDEEGNFYQASFRGNTVLQVAPDGTVTPFITEHLAGPVGVVIADDGTFYIANCRNHSVAQMTPDGEMSLIADGPEFACSNGITLDDEGNIYIANFNNGNITRVTPDGEASILATLPGNNLGHLVYRDGLLYTVARSAFQIYTVSLDGEVTLLAGTGTRGNGDGSALNATFSLPNDLIFSADGSELYINEGDALTTGRNHPAFVRAIVFAREE